jgi:choline dehydrogenase-like flavoprotein
VSEYSDVLIIGSGCGGAVMASRLSGRFSVRVIDKGDDWSGRFDPESDGPPLNAQGNRFRHTLDPRYLSRLAEVYTDPDRQTLNVVAGIGIGGGSNVYSGVSLRAPSSAFDQTRGRRLWPARYSRAALDPYYDEVERALRVHRLAWTDREVPHWQLATKRDYVFAEGCRRIGATAIPLKLASDQDANEGWWTQGQRFEGRQSLDKNYLAAAHQNGAIFTSGCEVNEIAPLGDRYVVRAIDRRQGRDRELELECKMLIVAAGSIASTGILLRSRDNFTGARAFGGALGRHLSGNGDYGVTGTVGDDFEFDVEGHKGKPIASICPSFFRDHGFVILPFYAEPLYLSIGRISTLLRAHDPLAVGRASARIADGEQDWGAAYQRRLEKFSSRMLTMGCLAFDDCEGEIELGDGARPIVRWQRTSDATEARWSTAVETMRRIYEALGGEMFLDSYRKDGTVNTSHPLGGCRMAEEPTEGVVDPNGECFGNRNLFVIDGSIIPSSLCANPSLTIAAVAESIADRLLRGVETESIEARLSP